MRYIKYLILLILLIPVLAWAKGYYLVSGVQEAGTPTWYYSGDGVYESADSNVDPAYAVSGQIDATGKTITKLGFSLDSVGSVTECKLALTAVGSTKVLRSVIISSISTGWNDGNITSYSASGNVAISVCCNNAYSTDYDNSSSGYWASGGYSSYPGAEITLIADPGKNRAVRIWAE